MNAGHLLTGKYMAAIGQQQIEVIMESTKNEQAQPTLTPDEANDLAYEFTKHLSPENIAYIKDRAATEGVHPSELLDNIINTSRTFYRSPVGAKHG